MVLGVGTDLLKISNLAPAVADPADAFVRKTYTEAERALILSRERPLMSYATRFAGKEAVFKCLGADGDAVRLSEIEILERETGQPAVTLHGAAAEIAAKKGIREVQISLSWDGEYALAFAVAIN